MKPRPNERALLLPRVWLVEHRFRASRPLVQVLEAKLMRQRNWRLWFKRWRVDRYDPHGTGWWYSLRIGPVIKNTEQRRTFWILGPRNIRWERGFAK